MRVDRRFLYIGLFLMVIGTVLVAADLGRVDTAVLSDIARLWPLALIALGAGIVLRRSQFSLPGGMFAAAIPGLVLGGALAMAPNVAGDCGDDARTRDRRVRAGHLRGARDGGGHEGLRDDRGAHRVGQRLATHRQQRGSHRDDPIHGAVAVHRGRGRQRDAVLRPP